MPQEAAPKTKNRSEPVQDTKPVSQKNNRSSSAHPAPKSQLLTLFSSASGPQTSTIVSPPSPLAQCFSSSGAAILPLRPSQFSGPWVRVYKISHLSESLC